MTMKKTKQQQQKAPNIYHEVRNYVKTVKWLDPITGILQVLKVLASY